jgi:hypothetical protein
VTDRWVLLIREVDQKPLKVRTFSTPEAALIAQQVVVLNTRPNWTAVIRDRSNTRKEYESVS